MTKVLQVSPPLL